jgi:hypothetical protein
MAKKNDDVTTVEITPVSTAERTVFLLGTTPFLCNRCSEKTKRELLFPARKKNAAEKATTLKHDPPVEYRASVYRDPAADAATRIVHPGAAFRRAMASAALDIPGATKAMVGRLVKVLEYNVSLFGVPRISAMIVREGGPSRTPNVRIRALLPQWACTITLQYSHPLITDRAVFNLLAASGEWIGVGDGRNEKGALTFGCFRIVSADDPDWLRVVAEGGAAVQDEALARPVADCVETEELLSWFDAAVAERGPHTNGEAKKERKEKVTR